MAASPESTGLGQSPHRFSTSGQLGLDKRMDTRTKLGLLTYEEATGMPVIGCSTSPMNISAQYVKLEGN